MNAYKTAQVRKGVKYALEHGTKTGRPFGRPPAKLPESFKGYYQQCQAGQITKTEFAKLLQVGRMTIYRWIKQYESQDN